MITIQEIATEKTFDNPVKQSAAIKVAESSNAIEGVETWAKVHRLISQRTTGDRSLNNLLIAQALDEILLDYYKQ